MFNVAREMLSMQKIDQQKRIPLYAYFYLDK